MGKLKVKKHDVWTGMILMPDVMVLLLTPSMSILTFVKNESVKVNQPSSVSEIKVPENDALNILVNDRGRAFMSMDNQNDLPSLIQGTNEAGSLRLTDAEVKRFQTDLVWGVPLGNLKGYLGLSTEEMTEVTTSAEVGVLLDPIDNGKSEFQRWVTEALSVNENIKTATRVDTKISHVNMKKVISELQDMNQNRYYPIITLKTGENK